FLALLGCGASGAAAARPETPQTATIAEKTAGAQKLPGYFNIYWDAKQGKLWLEIDKWGTEFLYQSSLPAGIGSNDIGLDRGQLGGTHLVRFERSGSKVLQVQSNLDFRAVSNDADERRAARGAEAITVRWDGLLVQVPAGGYRRRAYAPRAGLFGISYLDDARPMSEPIVTRLAARHRLEKKDRNAAVGEAVQPIVYY